MSCLRIVPFSNDLLNVIGETTILELEQTESVLSIKNEILKMEKRKPAVNDFIIFNLLNLDKLMKFTLRNIY